MATRTNNYGLIKPAYDDNIDVQNLNDNMDVLDDKLKTIEDNQKNRVLKTGDKMSGTLEGTHVTMSGKITGAGVQADYVTVGNKNLTLDKSDIFSKNKANFGIRYDSTGTCLEMCTEYIGLFNKNNTDGNYYMQLLNNGNIKFNADNTLLHSTNSTSIGLGLIDSSGKELNSLRLNKNARIYINGESCLQAGNSTALTLRSRNGKWTNFNDSGRIYNEIGDVWQDVYSSNYGDTWRWQYWKVSEYTAVLNMQLYSNYGGNNYYRVVSVTYPFPFVSDDYIIQSTSRHDGAAQTGYSDCQVGNCTTTGCQLTIDRDCSTSLLVIGRIK